MRVFLISADGTAISDTYDKAAKPCYDQQALMRRYDVIAEISDYMLELGWGPIRTTMRTRTASSR